MRKIGLLLFIVSIFLVSCKEVVFYNSLKNFENSIWTYEDIHNATFEIKDTTQVYDLYLDVIHNASFEYQNIYCKLNTTFPSKKTTEQQLPINFANNKGKWHGQCGTSSCKLRVVLQQNVSFQEEGSYQIAFEQYSRKPALEGIQSIDFIIKKVD